MLYDICSDFFLSDYLQPWHIFINVHGQDAILASSSVEVVMFMSMTEDVFSPFIFVKPLLIPSRFVGFFFFWASSSICCTFSFHLSVVFFLSSTWKSAGNVAVHISCYPVLSFVHVENKFCHFYKNTLIWLWMFFALFRFHRNHIKGFVTQYLRTWVSQSASKENDFCLVLHVKHLDLVNSDF